MFNLESLKKLFIKPAPKPLRTEEEKALLIKRIKGEYIEESK